MISYTRDEIRALSELEGPIASGTFGVMETGP
jgi:hypothetical protein